MELNCLKPHPVDIGIGPQNLYLMKQSCNSHCRINLDIKWFTHFLLILRWFGSSEKIFVWFYFILCVREKNYESFSLFECNNYLKGRRFVQIGNVIYSRIIEWNPLLSKRKTLLGLLLDNDPWYIEPITWF